MKLSDAAVLGAATWERICYAADDDEGDTEKVGCFLQLALKAVGFSAAQVSGAVKCAKLTAKTWPWTSHAPRPIDSDHAVKIWQMNDAGVSFEEILAYVRQHEPAEPEAQPDQLERMRENEYDSRANTR